MLKPRNHIKVWVDNYYVCHMVANATQQEMSAEPTTWDYSDVWEQNWKFRPQKIQNKKIEEHLEVSKFL